MNFSPPLILFEFVRHDAPIEEGLNAPAVGLALRCVPEGEMGFDRTPLRPTTNSQVSPRCRFVSVANSHQRPNRPWTRGLATKPEWHAPKIPGMHIRKSPQKRA
jgi:hypothetical protein